MENYSWQILITQAIVIIILLILIVYLFRQKRIIRLEKRFEDFALISIHDHEKSFFDSVSEILWKWIHNFAKFLNKSTFLKKNSLKYEKHIKYEDKDSISGMDYIAIKFLVGFALILLNILTFMFQVMKMTPMSFLITFLIGFFIPDIFIQIDYQK